MKEQRHRYRIESIGVLLVLGLSSPVLRALPQEIPGGPAGRGNEYDASWHTIDGGGVMNSAGGDYELSGTNQFLVKAAGSAWFYTNANETSGVRLPAGASSWSGVSDRATKENFAPVDRRAVLNKLAQMPLQLMKSAGSDSKGGAR